MNNYWGYHLMLNCSGCEDYKIRDAENIAEFARTLVKAIDMVPYGEPQVVHFGHSGKEGYTLIQLIETSNICAHFVEEDNSAYIDVFSCKEFHQTDVENVVRRFFGPKQISATYVIRQA